MRIGRPLGATAFLLLRMTCVFHKCATCCNSSYNERKKKSHHFYSQTQDFFYFFFTAAKEWLHQPFMLLQGLKKTTTKKQNHSLDENQTLVSCSAPEKKRCIKVNLNLASIDLNEAEFFSLQRNWTTISHNPCWVQSRLPTLSFSGSQQFRVRCSQEITHLVLFAFRFRCIHQK